MLNYVDVYDEYGTFTNSLTNAINTRSRDWTLGKLKGWSGALEYRNINGLNYENNNPFTNLMLTKNSNPIGNRIEGDLEQIIPFDVGTQTSNLELDSSSIAWSVGGELTFRSIYVNHAGYTTPSLSPVEMLHHVKKMAIMTTGKFPGEFAGEGDWIYYINQYEINKLERYNIKTGITEVLSSIAPGASSATVIYKVGESIYYWASILSETYVYSISLNTWSTYAVAGWITTDGIYGYAINYIIAIDEWQVSRQRFSDGDTTYWTLNVNGTDFFPYHGSRVWVSGGIVHIHNYNKHYAGTFGSTVTFQGYQGAVSNLNALWDNKPTYFQGAPDGLNYVIYQFLLDEDDTTNSVNWLMPTDIVKTNDDSLIFIMSAEIDESQGETIFDQINGWKILISDAITNRGIYTEPTETFEQMAAKILLMLKMIQAFAIDNISLEAEETVTDSATPLVFNPSLTGTSDSIVYEAEETVSDSVTVEII